MKQISVKKLTKVEPPKGEYDNIVAFQLVEFTINFFGHIESFILDTKILNDGRQLVIDGNGFIGQDYQVA
jgi:hypothetical protein